MSGGPAPPVGARDRQRFASFQQRCAGLNPKLASPAQHDVQKYGMGDRHGPGRLGLVTVARLLDTVEAYRVRWALQHLPYSVAKQVRTLMNPKARRDSSVAAWETRVLRMAWEALQSEGQFDVPWGENW
jgi:hypothetical protein